MGRGCRDQRNPAHSRRRVGAHAVLSPPPRSASSGRPAPPPPPGTIDHMRGVIVGFGLLAIAQAVLSRPDSSGRLAEGGSWLANAFRRLGSPAVAGVPQVRGVLT